jgi:hypothetical protein
MSYDLDEFTLGPGNGCWWVGEDNHPEFLATQTLEPSVCDIWRKTPYYHLWLELDPKNRAIGFACAKICGGDLV